MQYFGGLWESYRCKGEHVKVSCHVRWPMGRRETAVEGYSLCEDGRKDLGVRFFRKNSAKENWILIGKVHSKIGLWNTRELTPAEH